MAIFRLKTPKCTHHLPDRLRIQWVVGLFCLMLFASSAALCDTTVGGTISADTTWTLSGSPYIVTSSITVKGTDGGDAVTTLTIEPGVQVRFNGIYNLIIGATSGDPGALVAQGSAASPIVFTSNKATQAVGDWGYIQFYTTAVSSSVMDHCVVEYGGYSYGSVYLYNASPTIQNTVIRYSKNAGVYASGSSSPGLSGNQISNCNTYGINVNSASSAPVISGCTFSGNGNYDVYSSNTLGGSLTGSTLNNGLYISSGTNTGITGNTFNYNAGHPIRLGADGVGELVTANTFAGLDGSSYMEVTTDTIETDAVWSAALKYDILGSITVKGTDGGDAVTTLTIEPGVQVRFNGIYNLIIGASYGDPGALLAQGSAASPIAFTSNKATQAVGDWGYIQFYTTAASSSVMDHCVVEYGGYSYGSVYLYNASPTIQNTVIRYSKNAGVYASGSSSPGLSGNQISNCNTYGINVNSASSAPVISGCTFSGNGNYDVYSSNTLGGSLTGSTLNNGLYISSGTNTGITGNTFNYNAGYPIRLGADGVGELVTANTFVGLDGSSYMEVTTDTIETDAVWSAALKYDILGSITVKGTDGGDAVTTLTIEPGVQVRFNGIYNLIIGATSGDPGALLAQGSAASPIVFTSNKATQAVGDWGYIQFYTTAASSSVMDHCVVEYGGYSYGSVYLYNASPTITNTTIRFSKNAGIYAIGSGCSGATINCNTLTNNTTNGIYWTNTPPAELTLNNFINNGNYGIYYSYSTNFTAENNWWGDAAGPNQAGDAVYGNVDADPWSTAENQCTAAGENHPPNEPNTPSPDDQAMRVSVDSGLDLSWGGDDPDVLDTVTYDLYWGTDPAGLTITAQDIVATQYTMTGLSRGVTYYWQIIARDNQGLETPGPIWSFTSDGDPPDLIISQVTADPAGNLQTGQSVTLTATVQNNGSGPVVDPFTVDFQVDSASIGTVAIDQIILAGQSVQVSQPWTFSGGDSVITIIADSQAQVSETNEENNSFFALLSEVADNTAPVLVSSSPANGAYVQQVQQITVTLADSQGVVDDAAVIASFSVTDAGQQSVSGSITESTDTFTFVPTSLPLADGTYQVALSASDTYGNVQNDSFSFTIDTVPPAKPVITGGTVASGTIQVRPVQNISDQFIVELTGTREPGTSVWVDNVQRIALGDAPWSDQLTLLPGTNAFELWLEDAAGNQGLSEWLDIDVNAGEIIQYEYDSTGRIKRNYSLN